MAVKKYLDQNGLAYILNKLNDYPDNEILEAVINAIQQALNQKENKVSGAIVKNLSFTSNPTTLQIEDGSDNAITGLKIHLSSWLQDLTNQNLINFNTLVNGYYISSTGVPTASEDDVYTDLIPVSPGDVIWWTGYSTLESQTVNRRMHGYDAQGNWVKQIAYKNIGAGPVKYCIKGTIPNNGSISYIRVGWKLDTDVEVTVGEPVPRTILQNTSLTFSVNNTDYNMSFPGVYEGYIDVINGTITENCRVYQPYAGEQIDGFWISTGAEDIYQPGTLPTIGQGVVEVLENPIVTQIPNWTTPQIFTEMGDNTLTLANSSNPQHGINQITYIANTKVMNNVIVDGMLTISKQGQFKIGDTTLTEKQLKDLKALISTKGEE